jgi:16S rRNA G966 N2-methylase RsmD
MQQLYFILLIIYYNIRIITISSALCASFRVIKETGTLLHKTNPRNRGLYPTADKLQTLDLYSGCGGLSFGLEKSGLTKSKWAVEKDTSAADAFKKNFPHCHVFNEDVTDWFQRVQVQFSKTILLLTIVLHQ